MSGAGKSVTVCDLLSQTEGYFGYTVIIEEGLSYGIYTATVEEGARPIIIHPDGDLTINYLDTKGLPLTPDHLSAATALVARMIGTFESGGQTDAPAGADRQIPEPALRGFVPGLAEEAPRPVARHRPARDGVAEFSRRKNAARRDHPRNFCGLPRLESSPPGRSGGISAPIRGTGGVEIPERPPDQQGSPQPRLCPFYAGRVPDAPDASGVDDARPDGRRSATRSWKSPR